MTHCTQILSKLERDGRVHVTLDEERVTDDADDDDVLVRVSLPEILCSGVLLFYLFILQLMPIAVPIVLVMAVVLDFHQLHWHVYICEGPPVFCDESPCLASWHQLTAQLGIAGTYSWKNSTAARRSGSNYKI